MISAPTPAQIRPLELSRTQTVIITRSLVSAT
jgi:hypothetical protein